MIEREIEIDFFSGLKKSKTKQLCEFRCGGRNSHKIKVSLNMSKIVIGSSFPNNKSLFVYADRMVERNLVQEVKRWATEEFGLPPDSLPNDGYFKT